MKELEPKILAFLCNWAGYAAFDLAGTKHLRVPTFLEVRVMCTGRVDPVQMIEAFRNGYDGVMLVGCRKGECRYENGNYYAERRIYWLKKAFQYVGVHPDRLFCDWIGADKEQTFQAAAERFREKVLSLGKLAATNGIEKAKLDVALRALKEVFSGERMRWLTGRDLAMSGKTDAFGNHVPAGDFEKEVMDVFRSEYERSRILLASEDGAKSVVEIAAMTALKSETVMKEILVLKRLGKLDLESIVDGVPKYKRT